MFIKNETVRNVDLTDFTITTIGIRQEIGLEWEHNNTSDFILYVYPSIFAVDLATFVWLFWLCMEVPLASKKGRARKSRWVCLKKWILQNSRIIFYYHVPEHNFWRVYPIFGPIVSCDLCFFGLDDQSQVKRHIFFMVKWVQFLHCSF